MKKDRSPKKKQTAPKAILRLHDLDHAKAAVLNSLACPDAQRGYRHAIDEFIDWYCSEPRLSFNKTVVLRYCLHLEFRKLAPGTINFRLGAVRRLAYEAADCGLLSPDFAAGIRRVKGLKKIGVRLGNWLTGEQAQALWQAPDGTRVKGKRDPQEPLYVSLRGVIHALQGEAEPALECVRRACEAPRSFGHSHHTYYQIACVYALLEETSKALDWLERSVSTGFACWPFFQKDPAHKNLQPLPEFQALVKDLKSQLSRIPIVPHCKTKGVPALAAVVAPRCAWVFPKDCSSRTSESCLRQADLFIRVTPQTARRVPFSNVPTGSSPVTFKCLETGCGA